MSCERESLFTNNTRAPSATSSCAGVTPLDAMVTVVPFPPPGGGDGDDGEPQPPNMKMFARIARGGARLTHVSTVTYRRSGTRRPRSPHVDEAQMLSLRTS